MFCIICSLYNFYYRPGSSSKSIWLTNMNSYSSAKCITYSNTCPSTAVSSCSHSEDVTVECSKSYTVNWVYFVIILFLQSLKFSEIYIKFMYF